MCTMCQGLLQMQRGREQAVVIWLYMSQCRFACSREACRENSPGKSAKCSHWCCMFKKAGLVQVA